MKQKIIVVCLLIVGTLMASGLSTEMRVQSSETINSVTPETPEEEKSYYVENQERIFQQKEQETTYKIRYNTLQIQKCEFQKVYLQALEKQLETKLEIEQGKLNLGYSTEVSVMEIENQLNEAKLQISTIEAQEKQYKETIEIYGGVYAPVQVEEQFSSLSKDYVSEFLNDNLQIKYYDYELKTYQEYLDKNQEDEDIKIQKKLEEIEKQQYEADLQVYVKGKMLQYEIILNNITQVNSEMELIKEKIQTNQKLYESGKITEIEIMELETEQKRLEYERMSLIYDADGILYILEHRLENVEV